MTMSSAILATQFANLVNADTEAAAITNWATAWSNYMLNAVGTNNTGTVANIVTGAPTGQMKISGLTGIAAGDIGLSITITNAASSGNNGTFPIVTFIDVNNVYVTNASAVISDGNNGSLNWSEISIFHNPSTAISAMSAAMTGLSDTGQGPTKIQAGIVAYWGAITSAPGTFFPTASAVAAPSSLTSIASDMTTVFASNLAAALAALPTIIPLSTQSTNLAAVIHPLNLGGTVTLSDGAKSVT